MINGFVYLDRIKTKEEFDELIELAKVDSHGVYHPTHIVKRDEEKIGWFSIGANTPIVFAWLSTKKVTPRESFLLVNGVENHLALAGAVNVAFPVPKDSPFYALMKSMGYQNAGSYDFFVKKL